MFLLLPAWRFCRATLGGHSDLVAAGRPGGGHAATAESAAFGRRIVAGAWPAEGLKDLLHQDVGTNRSAGGDPSPHRRAVSHQSSGKDHGDDELQLTKPPEESELSAHDELGHCSTELEELSLLDQSELDGRASEEDEDGSLDEGVQSDDWLDDEVADDESLELLEDRGSEEDIEELPPYSLDERLLEDDPLSDELLEDTPSLEDDMLLEPTSLLEDEG